MRTPHALALFLLLLALARAEEEYDYRLQINLTQWSGHLDAVQDGLAMYDHYGFWVILTPSKINYVDDSNPLDLCGGPSFTLVSGANEFSLDMKGFRIENTIPHWINITVSPTNTGNCGGLYNMEMDDCFDPYHPLGFYCSHSLNTSTNTVEFTTSEGVTKLVNLASYISSVRFNNIWVFDFQTVPHDVNPSNVGAIVGGTFGGICGVALIVGGVYYYKKKHAATQDGYSSYQEPFSGTSTYAPPL